MRQKWRLHQGWYFREEDVAECLKEKGPEQQPEKWQEVAIPHTFRLEPYAHRGITTAQGIGTYVRYFPLEKELEKKKLYVTFEAVMGVTEVWLNGILLHTNYCGYLPFVVCLNKAAYFDGKDNVLVVRTDNRDNAQVPPGKPQELLDFTYFGGMYRDVWLVAVEDIFITDPIYEKQEDQGGVILEYPFISKEMATMIYKIMERIMIKRMIRWKIPSVFNVRFANNNKKASKENPHKTVPCLKLIFHAWKYSFAI